MRKRHEQLLFRYSSALERGDFEAVAEVLHDAERDPALEQMILDMNAAYSAETSVNHKNPKEVPMIAALYQKRPPAYVRWQSLPLVAALALIGLLVVMLAVQTRGANLSNIGDNGQNGTLLAVAQNNSICQTTTLAPTTLFSLPGPGGVPLYSIPAGEPVEVRTIYGNPAQWYYVSVRGAQGWVTPEALDLKNCEGNGQHASTATPNTAMQPSPAPGAITVADLDFKCGASTVTKIDLVAAPSLHPTVVGSLPADTLVTVMDFNIMLDLQGNQVLWYLVKADNNVQGWMPTYLLDAPACPAIPDLHIGVVSPNVQVQTATLQAALLATATQIVSNATRSAEFPTFTPTPAPFSETTVLPPTLVPPENDTAGIAQHPFYINPTFDPIQLTAIVATIIPAVSPMPADEGFLLDTCLIDLTNTVTLYAEPSNDARVTEILHIGTSLDVSAPTPDWYWVTVRYPDGAGSTGFVRAYTLKLPDDCHLSPVMTTDALVPTAVPAAVQALSTFTPVPANAQVDSTDCAFDSSDPGRIKLYTYPALDSRYAYDAWSSLYIPQSDFSLLDAKDIDDQAWYFVRIHRVSMDDVRDMQGWMTREEYDKNVRCAPLMNSGILTQVAVSLTATAASAHFNSVATMLPPTGVPALESTPTLVR